MRASSDNEPHTIAEFCEWDTAGTLDLSPDFQRGAVWSPAARSYLLDTILRRLPMPKVFIRTQVDRVTRKSHREVVDGKQRLSAILDFVNGEYALTSKAPDWQGKRFADLAEDDQDAVLSYRISVDNLFNASNEDVLEIFSRINTYTVTLVPPEIRHAQYGGPLALSIKETSRIALPLWEALGTFTMRELIRMYQDSLVADMYVVLQEGVRNGGETALSSFYKTYDEGKHQLGREQVAALEGRCREVLTLMRDEFVPTLSRTRLSTSYQVAMLFAAIAHAKWGLLQGGIEGDLPQRSGRALSDLQSARRNLSLIAQALEQPAEELSGMLAGFAKASAGATTRMKSRQPRFCTFYAALLPAALE